MRSALALAAVLAGTLTASSASADRVSIDFEGLAAGAVRVSSASAVRELGWPYRASCAAGPSVEDVSCRALKRRARAQLEGVTFRIEVAATVRVKSGVLSVFGCLDCADPSQALTVGTGPIVREGKVVLGPTVGTAKGDFSDQALAAAVTDFLFKLRPNGEPILVGFRAYNACTGEILAADPPSADRTPSKNCDEKPADEKPTEKKPAT